MLELQLGLRTNNSGVVAFNALKRAVYTLLCADTMVGFIDNHPKTLGYSFVFVFNGGGI